MSFHRKLLVHVSPSWVESVSLFFVTLCCERRGENQLCVAARGQALLETARYYESWELKAEYIRQNPVREGLISDAGQWPYLIEH